MSAFDPFQTFRIELVVQPLGFIRVYSRCLLPHALFRQAVRAMVEEEGPMRMALLILSLVSTLLTSGCAAGGVQPVAVATDRPDAAQTSADVAEVTSELLGLTQEWVRTWNEKDVDRMQQLHDDDFLYGVFGSFGDGRALLDALRRENFWGVTYTLKMVEPQVRILSSDTALVLFQLVGKSVGPKGARPYASLFTLVYQKRGGDWKIVHVHDSEASEGSS